jgi:hypothetical protein
VTDEAERIIDRTARIEVLRRECDEIVSILVASLRTAKANAQRRAEGTRVRLLHIADYRWVAIRLV